VLTIYPCGGGVYLRVYLYLSVRLSVCLSVCLWIVDMYELIFVV
jgi:hypothetical protein